jgi:hypothetical protein
MIAIDPQKKMRQVGHRAISSAQRVRGFLICLASAAVWLGAIATAAAQSADAWIEKGLEDLASQTAPKLFDAEEAFAKALQLQPNNHRALALKTITSLLLLTQDQAIRKLLLDAGYKEQAPAPGTPPGLTPAYVMPVDEEGVFRPESGAKTDQLLAYLNSRRNFINGLLAELGEIDNEGFRLNLGAALGEGGATDMDYADVRALRAALFLARGLIEMGNSHNLKLEYRRIYDLYAQGRLSMNALADLLPNFLRFADRARRAVARTELLRAEEEAQKAFEAFGRRTTLAQGRSFIFEVESTEAAKSTSDALALLADALTREVTLPQDPWVVPDFAGRRLNLSPLFTSSSPLRSLLPTGYASSGAFQRGTWPSTSFGGILPGLDGHLLDIAAASVWFEIKDDTYFLLEPAIYRPYNFKKIVGKPEWEWALGGMAVDINNDTLVADNSDGTIKRITADGALIPVLTTAQIPGSYGSFWFEGLGADAAGRIYFSDSMRVFRREANGFVSILAGTDSPPGWDYNTPRDGIGSAAVFVWISDLASDAAGNVYVVDGGTSVRKISTTGQVSTLAGKPYTSGSANGPGETARFSEIRGSIAIDGSGSGNIWVSDGGRTIRKIAANGTTSTVIATEPGRNLHYDDTPLSKASLFEIGGLAVDNDGNLLAADGTTVRKVTTTEVVTIGGRPYAEGSRGGRGGQARFSRNWGGLHLAMDKNGKLRMTSGGDIFSAESAPVIATQPAELREAYRGERVDFSVTATSPNPQFQWFFNGTLVRGATSPTYSVMRASDATAGDYTVAVTVDGVTETSRIAQLRIRPNADWSWAPPNDPVQTLEVGDRFTLAVEKVSGPPSSLISYQWFKDGRLLRGQTSRTLTISSIRLADAGVYELVITTSAGSERTNQRRLIVPDRGLLIYNLGGTGFDATAGQNTGRRANAVVVIDRVNQKAAFIWHATDASGKRFRVEQYPEGIAMHSTGPAVGSTSVLSRAETAGAVPNIGKDLIWFTGTDSWRRLIAKNGSTTEMLGPTRLKGGVHTLSLSNGVAIKTLDATMSLEANLTLRARSGSWSFDQAVNRITEEFATRGYTPGL